MRQVIKSMEYMEFYNSLPKTVREKVDYVYEALTTLPVLPVKFVKKIENTKKLYEMRISVDNEYRVILFSIDHDNIIQAKRAILLNGFIKKSTKDYPRQIKKAEAILNTIEI